ncbi:MAG: hypothetical protein U5K55_05440 [Aliarcobacter sp.]|nr:hypothetical protein [Aliarcobacter sp.]
MGNTYDVDMNSQHFTGLTAYAQSLAVVQPQLLRVMIEDKQKKLTQMGKEVFGMPHNYEMVIEAIEYKLLKVLEFRCKTVHIKQILM